VNKLIKCEYCDSQISDTALRCPVCGKVTGSKEALSKKIGMLTLGAAAALLTGTAGIAAIMVGGIFDFSSNRQLQNISEKLGVIDSFNLTDGLLVLVNDTKFITVLTGAGGSTEFPGFLRSDLHHAYIDENKSKKGGLFTNETTVLYLEYFDTNYRKKEVKESHKFKGKNSHINAEFVLAKLLEYKLSANKSISRT